ncbi:PAS domain S-box protein [Mucilaginibacter gotjawali]|uniref:Response regulator of RpoS n=2 Tax=Mucilaginibacter gotjawali TaxID=1550579 RepID=A0A110B2P9_9SPHI|nr:PAS domain S-box protein [Mucilaginibacter gotjawali]MBB3054069.1 PAS domain S-box-containing protein [Mucilaginibacter gotjawali]BAU54338.1 response regulator of RpoS [Mucilaginibacter gotjawali]
MKIDKRPYTILVIEDNPGDVTLVEDFLLEHIEYLKLNNARNFKTAKEILSFQNGLIDAVLLDLSLPDKSGVELILDIVALCRKTPVIVLTGNSDFCFGAKSLSLGVSDYLLKDELTSLTLYKSIVYGIERKKATSALEESEKKYSELFHLSPMPMYVVDLETLEFLNVNRAAIRHYGYSRDEFLRMTIRDIRPAEDIPVLEEGLLSTQYEDQLNLKGSFRHKLKNGNIIYVEVQGSTIMHKGRKAKLVLVIDVTEKLRYTKAIEEQNEKLREISWIQSHMVRAPVARILGLIAVLKVIKDNNNEMERVLNYLEISADELDLIIREITDKVALPDDFEFAKIEALAF